MTRRPAVLIPSALRYDGVIPLHMRRDADRRQIIELESAAKMHDSLGMTASAKALRKKARKLMRGQK
jgi:hypothetical protein